MSRWPGKYVIGLTGNIGTGKSVVRHMLEYLGAYGIDADVLSHRVIEKGAPGYIPVIENFGRYILRPDGEIDRGRLGRIVFSDPEAMRLLEAIIHPLVSRAVDLMIARVNQRVIVIEAIKLLEGSLAKDCSSIWVTFSPPERQMQRLISRRKMTEAEALQRIKAQAPQEEKLHQADVTIENISTLTDTWRQVLAAWKKTLQEEGESKAEISEDMVEQSDSFSIEAGKPSHAQEIADFYNRVGEGNGTKSNPDRVMEAFGEKAFLLLRHDTKLVGLAGWQVENLVARTTELIIEDEFSVEITYPLLIETIEVQSRDLQCEVSLVFVTPAIAQKVDLWYKLGYRQVSIQEISVLAWKEAARESKPADTVLLFKQLRKQRILRPI